MSLRRLLGRAGGAIDVGTSVQEAAELLAAYHLPALPVTRNGQILGVVTEAGLRGAANLESVVEQVPILGPGAPVEAARAALEHHRALVVDSDPPGVLSPTDLAPAIRPDLAERVWASLRPEDAALLQQLAQLAGPDARVALVGGAVRDALTGQHPTDLDVVVVGADVEALAGASGLAFTWHPKYRNATLSLPVGRQVDVVSARSEAYPVPGGPPEPRPGTLAQDQTRRDFGLNALAVVVGEPGLWDPMGGLADLEAGELRPLHALSCRDDASRLVRAARLAARLHLRPHPDLLAQVPQALALADQMPRLWQELRLALDEPRPGQVFALLDRWGAGSLIPGAANRLKPLDDLRDVGEGVTPPLYAARLTQGDSALAQRLGLGEAPLRLWARAHDGQRYAADSNEVRLRSVLGLPLNPFLSGSELIALGIPPGPPVGAWLSRIAQLTRTGELTSPEAARRFVQENLRREE